MEIIDQNHKMIITAYPLLQDGKVKNIIQTIDKAMSFQLPITKILEVAAKADDGIVALWDAAVDYAEDNTVGEALRDLAMGASGLYNKLNTITEDQAKSSSMYKYKWVLPIPNTVTDNTSHNYETDELDVSKKMMLNSTYMLAKIFSPKVADKSKDAIESMVDLAKRKNIVFNPQRVNMYTGTGLRSFNFSFNLVASNQTEYDEYLKGILAFKYYMSGSAPQSSMFMKQNYVFKIKFMNPKLEEMIEISNVEFNLTSLSVDYGADGEFSMTNNGAVKHILLVASFEERKPRYSNKVEEKTT